MKSDKGVVFGIFILGIVLISIISVSAGWKDIFSFGSENKDLEGELPTANYDVSVQVSNTAPLIKKFVAVIEDDDSNNIDDNLGTGAGIIQGDAGGSEGDGIMKANFKFVVEDLDGKADLPGYIGGPAIVYGTNLVVEFSAPTNAPVGSTQKVSAGAGDCTATSCQGNALCPDQTATTNQVIYTCYMKMNYFNPPSPNGGATANDKWKFKVKIIDSTNVNNDEAISGDTGFNALANDYMTYNNINAVSVATGVSIGWTNLNTNLADNKADGPLTLENGGNIAVAKEDLTAKDLQQTGTPANKLLATAFSAGAVVGGTNLGACDVTGAGGPGTGAKALIHNTAVEFTTTPIPYTGAGLSTDKTSMYFCIWPVTNSPTYMQGDPSKSYAASVVNGNRWTIIFKS